jgi:hypothetical protein
MSRQIQADLEQFALLKAKKELSPEEEAVVEAFIDLDEAEAAATEQTQDAASVKAEKALEATQKALEAKPSETV